MGRWQRFAIALGVAAVVGHASHHIARADTFSIAAVDTETGALGSAGASCVGPYQGIGAFILSDIVPGMGVIHTQAAYDSANQQAARERMVMGEPPQQIVDWLAANDSRGDSSQRQYGIVDLARGGESAAFTGDRCTDWKGHRTGPGYSIQGNILSGPEIVEDMERAFTDAGGPLEDRLMAALEAAKVVGADTRCASRGTSSQSAFIKVVYPDDGDTPHLELVVPDSQPNEDPIDVLGEAFEAWRDELSGGTVYVPVSLSLARR